MRRGAAISGDAPAASSNVRPSLLLGYVVILLMFGAVGGWASTAPLASAVIAPGVVVVESSRKTVAHFEGGIVEAILVEDADRVAAGDVLVRLQNVKARASADLIAKQLASALALEARLLAERNGSETVAFPEELDALGAESFVATVRQDQQAQFRERRGSLAGQTGILRSRIEQNHRQIAGLEAEREGMREQLRLFEDELVGLRRLYEQGYYPRTRILAMERKMARVEGEIGSVTAEIGRAEEGIGEAELQIRQLRQGFQEKVVAALRETRQRLSDLREKAAVTGDVLRRVEITAPQAGTVQNLQVHTVGGVVKGGQPLMEIVPVDDVLVVEARIAPTDIDSVEAGMPAEVRLSAFSDRTTPTVAGRLASLSADRLIDRDGNEAYFRGRIRVDEASLDADLRDRITPGMPADVMIRTGERTLLDYMISPLEEILAKGMRER